MEKSKLSEIRATVNSLITKDTVHQDIFTKLKFIFIYFLNNYVNELC